MVIQVQRVVWRLKLKSKAQAAEMQVLKPQSVLEINFSFGRNCYSLMTMSLLGVRRAWARLLVERLPWSSLCCLESLARGLPKIAPLCNRLYPVNSKIFDDLHGCPRPSHFGQNPGKGRGTILLPLTEISNNLAINAENVVVLHRRIRIDQRKCLWGP